MHRSYPVENHDEPDDEDMLGDENASDNLIDAFVNMMENRDAEGGGAEKITFHLQSQ